MMEQEIVDYIAQAQKHGLADFEIKQNLLNVGWEAAVVEENFVFAKAAENKTLSGASRPPQTHVNLPPVDYPQAEVHSAQIQTPRQPVIPPKDAIPPITDQHFQKPVNPKPSKPFFKQPLLWIVIAALLIIGGGAYGYYNYFYTTPATVWQKFLAAKKNPASTAVYSFSYTDSGFGAVASSTQSLNVTLSGTAQTDFSDNSSPKMANDLNLALGAGTESFNLKFKYLLLNQVLYFDVSQIDALKNLMPGQNLGWIKVDLSELQQYASQAMASSSPPTAISPELKTKLNTIWSKANVVTGANFLAKEKINNTAVYHLKNQFNSQAFGTAVLDSLNAIQSSAATNTQQLTDQQKQALTALFNKFQAKEFDVWIGQSDYQIYKIHLLVNAPSISDLSNPALADLVEPLRIAKAKSRDAKRLADVRQMSSALQLYFNDFKGYPESLDGAAPALSPTYLDAAQPAPEPADGSCTDYYNAYWYTAQGKAAVVKGVKVYPSYTLTFCLGQDTGGYAAGIGQLTPQGIAGNIACPSTPDKCVSSGQIPAADFTSIINQMAFKAQLQIDISYSDFGKTQNIQAPQDSTDILDLIKNYLPASAATTTPAP